MKSWLVVAAAATVFTGCAQTRGSAYGNGNGRAAATMGAAPSAMPEQPAQQSEGALIAESLGFHGPVTRPAQKSPD